VFAEWTQPLANAEAIRPGARCDLQAARRRACQVANASQQALVRTLSAAVVDSVQVQQVILRRAMNALDALQTVGVCLGRMGPGAQPPA